MLIEFKPDCTNGDGDLDLLAAPRTGISKLSVATMLPRVYCFLDGNSKALKTILTKHMALGIFSEQTILVLQGLNLILSLVIIACNRLLQALQRLLSQL